MASSAPRWTGSIPPMFDCRNSEEKNKLLSLAFEEQEHTTLLEIGASYDPKSLPAHAFKQSVRDHATMMGMLLPEDEKYLWIAEESLFAHLPEGWVRLRDDGSGHDYYYNQVSGESTWDHPRSTFYINLYREKKGIEQVSSLKPPAPPSPSSPSCGTRHREESVRYGGQGVEEPSDTGDGDSACDEEFCNYLGCKDDVCELDQRLEKYVAERHEQEPGNRPHDSKKEGAEKMSAKLKETCRTVAHLQDRLAVEVHRPGEQTCLADRLRNKAEDYKRRLLEANAHEEAERCKFQQERRVDEMSKCRQIERQTLDLEKDQMRAKMEFQVEERVREEMEAHHRCLSKEIDDLRSSLDNSKKELSRCRRDADAAEACSKSKQELEKQVTWLTHELKHKVQEVEETCNRSADLANELAQKNKLVGRVQDLQRAVKEAQEGLRAANSRFDAEIMRINSELANAEGALEEKIDYCKKLETDSKAAKEKSEAMTEAARAEIKRLTLAMVSLEASLTESRCKVQVLVRQIKDMQQQVEASEGLERDIHRLQRDAQDMAEKAQRDLQEKERDLEVCRSRLDESDATGRKLRESLAEAEGRALYQKEAADRLATRVSSLEAQVLDGRAELACAKAYSEGTVSELAAAREAAGDMKDMKAVAEAEAKAREESLNAEIATLKKALEAAEAAVERERVTKVDKEKHIEGAEARCDSLLDLNKEANQKLQVISLREQRLQKEVEKAKEREAYMWAQLQEISTKFAETSRSSKEGETMSQAIDAKIGDLEQQLRQAEKQALNCKMECERLREGADRELKDKAGELENLRDRLSRKKEKFAAQKLALEHECKGLHESLSETRALVEGMRIRCTELAEREEYARTKIAQMQEAQSASDQEAAGARAEAAGLRCQLVDLKVRFENETQKLQADVEASRQALETASIKVATEKMDSGKGSQQLTDLKFKIMEAQGEMQQLRTAKDKLEERAMKEQVRYAQLEAASREARLRFDHIQEENESNKRQAECAREEAGTWKAKFESESVVRRSLNAKVLDMQGNVRVLCRVRPLKHSEIAAIEKDDDYEDPMANIVYPDVDKLTFWGVPYQFDYVFGPGTQQAKVFDEVESIVASVLEGYRVCVFAYGQTGSGKTFTMEGAKNDRGVNFRALEELFSLSSKDESKHFQIKVSMLEVYNESIKDLLEEPSGNKNDKQHGKHHDIRVDKKGRVYVEGLVEREVKTLGEVEEVLVRGGRSRTVGNNNVNEHSSRSHLVLQVHVSNTDVASGYVQHGKLNLIDLAGSERIKSTAAEGQRLKEAQNINRSLSALGDVISALGSGSKHVPYRNSKLTFLLQDSLASSAKVLMMVNINPNPQSQGESSCTLNFAKRCRSVQLGASRKIGMGTR